MLGFLFDTRTITVTLDKKDYEDFEYLVNTARAQDPSYDMEKVLINLIRQFNKKHVGNVAQQIISMDKKTNPRKKRVSLP